MGCQMDTLFYQYTQCDFDFFFNRWINNTLNKVDFLIENPILSIIFLLNSIVHFIPIPIFPLGRSSLGFSNSLDHSFRLVIAK